jgi:hypothetical protein
VLGRAGEPQPTGGLLQAAREEDEAEEEEKEEKEEAEVVGGVRSRPEATEEDVGVDARDADMGDRRAMRVSRARPGLEGLGGTTVDPESQEMEEEREPRRACPPWPGDGGERREEEDLGICDNSPTNPGALAAGKS